MLSACSTLVAADRLSDLMNLRQSAHDDLEIAFGRGAHLQVAYAAHALEDALVHHHIGDIGMTHFVRRDGDKAGPQDDAFIGDDEPRAARALRHRTKRR